jgi:hypothetical protein
MCGAMCAGPRRPRRGLCVQGHGACAVPCHASVLLVRVYLLCRRNRRQSTDLWAGPGACAGALHRYAHQKQIPTHRCFLGGSAYLLCRRFRRQSTDLRQAPAPAPGPCADRKQMNGVAQQPRCLMGAQSAPIRSISAYALVGPPHRSGPPVFFKNRGPNGLRSNPFQLFRALREITGWAGIYIYKESPHTMCAGPRPKGRGLPTHLCFHGDPP